MVLSAPKTRAPGSKESFLKAIGEVCGDGFIVAFNDPVEAETVTSKSLYRVLLVTPSTVPTSAIR